MAGIGISALIVAAETLLAFLLQGLVPASSMNVIYVLGVLVVSYACGLVLGTVTAVASGLIYDYFLLPPFGVFTLADRWAWATLLIFVITAVLAGGVAALLRSLVIEADERRRDAVVDARMARLLLRTEHLREALPLASRQLARTLGLPFATIETDAVEGDERRDALPLMEGANRLGTLTVPTGLPEIMTRRVHERVVPSLEALLHAAHERVAINQALEVSREELRRFAAEQAALRRVATLVASGVPPVEIFNAVAAEVGKLLGADRTVLERYTPEAVVLVCSWAKDASRRLPAMASRRPLDDSGIWGMVMASGQPMRMPAGEERKPGEPFTVGVPIIVEARLWGVMIAYFGAEKSVEESVEERMVDFTELLVTAVSNAQARDELAASRGPMVRHGID
ncbi:DUF4118 domain-containing protein [Acrocarpospora pleiomorpha]|nr:DUF4118 domain-containing protein [Acrocarpospora pleiomorpha]